MCFRSYLKISQVRHYVTIIVFIIIFFNILPFVIALVFEFFSFNKKNKSCVLLSYKYLR